jgi:hypothetical protein
MLLTCLQTLSQNLYTKDVSSLNPHLLLFYYRISFPLFQFLLFKLNNGRFTTFKVFLSLIFQSIVFNRFLKLWFHYHVILLYNEEVCGLCCSQNTICMIRSRRTERSRVRDLMRWIFSIYLILPAVLGPGVNSASNRNEYQKHKHSGE